MARHKPYASGRAARKRSERTRRRRLALLPLEPRILLTAIITVDPPANSHVAAPNSDVSVTFDQPINPATVSSLSFAVHAMQHRQLVGPTASLSTTGNTVALNPSADFSPGELVQATVTANVQSTSGDPAVPFVWQWRAGAPFGTGVFAADPQILGDHLSLGVALGDLDSDGDLDAVTANYTQANRVWLNSDGQFVDSGQELGGTVASSAVQLGDFDGDGDLDAFISNYNAANRLWLNDGGTFTDSGQSLGDHASTGVAVGDLDGDGDLDALVTNTQQANLVWINSGGLLLAVAKHLAMETVTMLHSEILMQMGISMRSLPMAAPIASGSTRAVSSATAGRPLVPTTVSPLHSGISTLTATSMRL